MRRLALAVVVAALSLCASAQSRYGVVGGMTFSNTATTVHEKEAILYHAGITYQYKFVQGFSIQPSILYHAKGVGRDAAAEGAMRVSSIEIPVAFQWGPDLLLFRPYIEVAPYVGFNVLARNVEMTKAAGGVGLGGGIEIWHLQISARYNWDFLSAYHTSAKDPFRYATLSLAVLF